MDSLSFGTNLQELISPVIKWLREIGFAFSGPAVSWTVGQLAVIVLAGLIAFLLNRRLTAACERQLHAVADSEGLTRLLTVVISQIKIIVFAALLWSALVVMRAITWPSRSQIILSAASLATAWLVISTVSKLIRNRTISKTVALLAWVVAALNIVGLLPATLEVLDATAIQFDDFRLSLLVVLKGILTLSLLLWLAVTLGQFADTRIRAIEDLTPSLKVLVGKLARALLIIIAILWGLNIIGIQLTAFAVFSGAIGLGIGFGLQKVVSNLISGFILLADKSIKPGDVISVDDTYGRISQLAARYVSVVARDGREFLIPNEDLITNKVINWSFTSELVRLDVHFGVSYNADPHEVRPLACKAAASELRVVSDPAPVCHITGFGDSSVDYILRFWIRDPHQGTTNIRGNVFLALWDALKEAGIEIPYPHRQVIVSQPVPVEIQRK
jgi:small-conductance mechanosensitive channel